jgi:hypothetical protein
MADSLATESALSALHATAAASQTIAHAGRAAALGGSDGRQVPHSQVKAALMKGLAALLRALQRVPSPARGETTGMEMAQAKRSVILLVTAHQKQTNPAANPALLQQQHKTAAARVGAREHALAEQKSGQNAIAVLVAYSQVLRALAAAVAVARKGADAAVQRFSPLEGGIEDGMDIRGRHALRCPDEDIRDGAATALRAQYVALLEICVGLRRSRREADAERLVTGVVKPLKAALETTRAAQREDALAALDALVVPKDGNSGGGGGGDGGDGGGHVEPKGQGAAPPPDKAGKSRQSKKSKPKGAPAGVARPPATQTSTGAAGNALGMAPAALTLDDFNFPTIPAEPTAQKAAASAASRNVSADAEVDGIEIPEWGGDGDISAMSLGASGGLEATLSAAAAATQADDDIEIPDFAE